MGFIHIFLIATFTGLLVFAQGPGDEAEVLNGENTDTSEKLFEEEEISSEPEPEIATDQDYKPTPPRLRRRSRFGQKNDKAIEDLKSRKAKNSDVDFPTDPEIPTTPVKDIQVQGQDKKKKLTFAEAHPEDITDENFPDLIKSFDYPNANIMDVANAIGKLTKKNFIIEPGVSGKITIVAPTPVTVAQAWKLFLSALAMNGYTIVPTNDGYLKIRKATNAINDSIETYSGAYYPTSDQLITRIIRLKYIQASSLKKSLEKFVPKNKKTGKVEAYDDTNSVIISGYGSSVQRISTIIEELDKPGFEERLEVIPIRHAKSKSIADLVMNIIKGGEKTKKGGRFSRSRFKNKAERVENLKLVTPDERTNSIIVVGNAQGIRRIKKLVKQLDYPLDPADAGGVYVYYVKHGDANLIAETLSGVTQEDAKKTKKGSKKDDKSFMAPKAQKPIFGGSVVIKADENTNSLIVTASKQDYQVVRNLLAKIDIPKDQVFVEAIIMEMEASTEDIWNLNYMKFFKGKNKTNTNNNQGGGAARVGFTGRNFAPLLHPAGSSGAILNLGDPKETIQLTMGGQSVEIPSLLALINFLKKKTNANILSTPHILAMDNEESEIEVGEEVPVGGTQNFSNQGITSITPQFKPATILLKIKPYISPDSDIVRLEVEQKIQKVSSEPIRASALAQSTQSLTKKLIKTNIVLESGQTAVLGGLMEDEDSIEEDKVPLLGDIPILGWLFKNKSITRIKKNLVVFLTPTIIRSSFGHRRLLHKKINQRIDWIKKYHGGRDPYGERFNSLIESSVSTTNPGEAEWDLEEVVPRENENDDAGESKPTPLGDDELRVNPVDENTGVEDINLMNMNEPLPIGGFPEEISVGVGDESVETPGPARDSSMFWNTTPSFDQSLEESTEENFENQELPEVPRQ